MPLVFDPSKTRENLEIILAHNITLFDNARTTEKVSFSFLNISVSDNARTTESITSRTQHNISKSEKVFVRELVNTANSFSSLGDKSKLTEFLTLALIETETRKISIYESANTTESLFNFLRISIAEKVFSRDVPSLGIAHISLVDNPRVQDTVNIYIDEEKYGYVPPYQSPAIDPGSYGDHLSADLLKGDRYFETVTTFWNQPFPTDLITENGNVARFSKTWYQTHTSIRNRKCSIRLELTRSDDSTQIINIGTFLIGTSEQKDDIISLQLEDLTKKFIETTADDVKSGFQWYRNIPLDSLVEELVKKVYPDPRNGEIPRDYIINGIRPPNPSGEPVISSLGRPPTYTKITNNLSTKGRANVLCKADLGIRGEKLYLGVGKFLYEYDEITQKYVLIGDVSSTRTDIEVDYEIKRLWYNEQEDIENKWIYGTAWPKEELVYDDGEFNSDGSYRKKRYSGASAVDWIIFKANNDGIQILYDSAIHTNTGLTDYYPTLFTGEYHFLSPYITGKNQSYDDYFSNNNYSGPNQNLGWWADDFPNKAIHTGYGHVMYETPNPGQNYKYKKIIKVGSQEYRCGFTENICLPYAQNIGFGGNFIQEALKETWVGTTYLYGGDTPYWSGNNVSIDYSTFQTNFGFHYGPEYYLVSQGRGWKHISNLTNPTRYVYLTFYSRPRIFIRGAKDYWEEQPSFVMHAEYNPYSIYRNTNGILTTKPDESWINSGGIPAGFQKRYTFDESEIIKGVTPGVHYERDNPTWENFPYEDISNHKFDPGYVSWYFEGLVRGSYDWTHAPVIYNKYSSGQTGSLAYLKNWGTKGAIFFQGQVKYYLSSPSSDPVFKTMGYRDFYTPSGHLDVPDFQLCCYLFDLDTQQFYFLQNMTHITFRDDRVDAAGTHQKYPMQITAVTVKENANNTYELFVAAQTFANKHFAIYIQNEANKNAWQSYCYLMRVVLGDISGNTVLTQLSHKLDKPGTPWYGSPDYVITDLNIISNSETPAVRKLLITYYEKEKLIQEYDWEGRPIIGNCYGLTHAGLDSDVILQFKNLFFDLGGMFGDRLMPFPMHRLAESSIKTPGENVIYAVEPMDRTEETNSVRLRKFRYDDTFWCKDGSGSITHPYNDKNTILGYISDSVYGESNQLSNLELMTIDGFEIIYGVTNCYFPNGINKIKAKNHLWKYDLFLGGIIELADLSNLNIWDAITQLAQGFNFITGFDEDRFFFIPRALSNTNDILIDADLDGVLEISKIRDYKVENIIRTTPYISKVGDVTWEIVVIPNETTANDTDRVQLNVDLRVRQEDDLTKNVSLKVCSKGEIAQSADYVSSLRFSYLIYNNVISTKLMRDLGATEVYLTLPSFYGQDLSTQVMVGDVISFEKTEEESGETYQITRTIEQVDYNSNMIKINKPLDEIFLAYTPITIYRSNTNVDGELRNNQWSDSGVTYLIDWGSITGVWNDETQGWTDRAIDVGSIRNLGIGTLIRLGDDTNDHIIYAMEDADESPSGYPRVYFRAYQNADLISDGPYPPNVAINKIVKAFWAPTSNDLIEVGGSKVFLGFAPGSSGTFWSNYRGEDQINIECPGLMLEADNRAMITVVDSDSISRFGKFTTNLDENRFIQPSLHEYMARVYLHAHSKPKLTFKVKNLIQAIDKGGYTYMLPPAKLLNVSEKRLFNVRLVSKKLLTNFWGYYIDCYIMEHSFSLKTFSQDLLIKSINSY